MTGLPAPARVVLLALGDAQPDDRVRRIATDLARRGLAVTILITTPGGHRGETRLGTVRIRRVPLGHKFRDWGSGATAAGSSESESSGHRESTAIRVMGLKRQWAGLEHRRLARSWWDLRLRIARRWPSNQLFSEWGWARSDRDIAQALDLETAVASEIDSLEPDFVQAGAEFLVPAARAKARAVSRGRRLRVLYDSAPLAAGRSWLGADVTERLTNRMAAAVDGVIAADTDARAAGEHVLEICHRFGADLTEATERPAWDEPERLPLPARSVSGPLFGMGPTNSAGQAAAWTGAANRAFGLDTRVVAIQAGAFAYAADEVVTAEVFARDRAWQERLRTECLSTWTHALVEAGRPLFGTLNGSDFRGDVEEMRDAGIHVGLVFHGSEVRDPRRHRDAHAFSPFADPDDPYTATLQAKCDQLLALLDGFDGPTFVSTLDLLDYVPKATWLPVTVDMNRLPTTRPLTTSEPPLVVHAPSNPVLKGTAAIEAVLQPLAEAGRIRYRRLQGITPAEVAATIADADVVVDQVLLGLYGHLACEAMAMGRCVVGNVGATLRERSPAEVPIVEANPETLAAQMEALLADPEILRSRGEAGRDFVARFHNGDAAAEALASFLSSGTGGGR